MYNNHYKSLLVASGRKLFRVCGGCDDPIGSNIRYTWQLHLEGDCSSSRRCLHLICSDDIGFREFTIYEMMKGSIKDFGRNFNAYRYVERKKELKTIFKEQANQELFETVKAFHVCKQEDGQFVSSYLLKMKSYLDTLEHLGYAMPNEHGVSLILNFLNKDYDQFAQNYNMHSIWKTIAELHAKLKLHEKGIPKKAETLVVLAIREGKIQKDKKKLQGAKGKDKGKNKFAYAPKPKILPPPKRDNLAKDSICQHCKKVGHWRRNCPSYQAELRNKKNASGASTSCRLRGSRKLKHRALSLYMGNGMHAVVKAIGSLDLVLPSVARKPFPHQVERAKDLLGLIHTDVCGPFRTVSREGASYFITFTDDFSRYGYVYLMKHKHEGYALKSATRILNMVPTKKVDRTPYEIWHGKAPKLSYLRVWGCEAHVKRDTPDKLDSKSIKCIFKGYPKEMMGYYFYNPLENTIFVAQNAEFFENSLTLQEASESHRMLKASRSDAGLELIQEDDTQPFENTSKRHDEIEPNEVHELGDLNEPPNYKATLSAPEFDKWLDAMNTKMQSMKDNQFWSLVDLPLNDIRAIRILLAIAAVYDYEIWQIDVKTAFLNGHLMKYIVAAEASMGAVWMRKFIDVIGDVMPSNKRPMGMLCDNAPAIAIANDPRIIRERSGSGFFTSARLLPDIIKANITTFVK
ncbi:zinc finger, CCHC-type containing protein [Tanacetum coccineum]